MPKEDKTRAALPAQIVGAFNVTVESHFDDCVERVFKTETIELFPQTETISVISSNLNSEGFYIELAPRAALDLAKKLMAMCAAYTEDIGACDPCGELFPTEELHDVDTEHGPAILCTICMESGR